MEHCQDLSLQWSLTWTLPRPAQLTTGQVIRDSEESLEKWVILHPLWSHQAVQWRATDCSENEGMWWPPATCGKRCLAFSFVVLSYRFFLHQFLFFFKNLRRLYIVIYGWFSPHEYVDRFLNHCMSAPSPFSIYAERYIQKYQRRPENVFHHILKRKCFQKHKIGIWVSTDRGEERNNRLADGGLWKELGG